MFNNVDPTTGLPFAVGPNRLYQPDYNNWAPRVSVAWDIAGKQKTVVRAGYGVFYDGTSQDMFIGHLPFSSSFDPGVGYSGLPGVGQISFGSPGPIVSGQPVFSGYLPMADAFGIDPHIRTPYLQNYNLNIQQQLTRKMVLQVGYVGSHGSKLWDFRDLNQPSQAQITAADLGCDCINDFSVPRRLTGTTVTTTSTGRRALPSPTTMHYRPATASTIGTASHRHSITPGLTPSTPPVTAKTMFPTPLNRAIAPGLT